MERPSTRGRLDRLARLAAAVALGAALVACQDSGPGDDLTPPPPSPPPPLPTFGASGPTTPQCFPEHARERGVPRLVPVPASAELHGPDSYAAAYAPEGEPARRIRGRGFFYEVSARVGVVAGFIESCLDRYTRPGWARLPAEAGDVIVRIPTGGAQPAVLVIAGTPIGRTAVVVFVEHRIAAPSPAPSPTG